MWLFYLEYVFQTISVQIFQSAGAELCEVILGGKQLNSCKVRGLQWRLAMRIILSVVNFKEK